MRERIPIERPELFLKRLDAERAELGRELRAQNYDRAATIAEHIRHTILFRIGQLKDVAP